MVIKKIMCLLVYNNIFAVKCELHYCGCMVGCYYYYIYIGVLLMFYLRFSIVCLKIDRIKLRTYGPDENIFFFTHIYYQAELWQQMLT